MANELKPCPYRMDELRKILREDMGNFHNLRILTCVEEFYRNAMNTRPAAPVEGLETVGKQYLWEGGTAEPWRQYAPIFPETMPGLQTRELVTRSQAEAIIAAKDREVEAAMVIYRAERKWRADLEADNTALTARVKELGTVSSKLCDDVINYELKVAERDVSLKALETQLAKLREQKPVGSYQIEHGQVISTTDYFPDGLPFPDGDLELYAHPVDSAAMISALESQLTSQAAQYKDLEDYAREATKAITGLTGGGSENFSKQIGELFTADLPLCLERIRERYVSKVEVKRLETQLAAARKALADIASHDMICLKDPYRTILQAMINTARAALKVIP